MSPIRFFVPGIAAPGGSKIAQVIYGKGGAPVVKNGRVVTVAREAAKGNAQWRSTVASRALDAYRGAPLDCPLAMGVVIFKLRPQGHFNAKGLVKPAAPAWPTGAPDATKLMRAIEDALEGILYTNDSRLIASFPIKCYTRGQAGAQITLLEAKPGALWELLNIIERDCIDAGAKV